MRQESLDQANRLRNLMVHREGDLNRCALPAAATPTDRANVFALTSGKGGVGKSVLVVNTAVALAQLGRRVCILDAASGVGSIDLLCGLNGFWNLSHVLTGAKRLDEIILHGPEGVDVIPGFTNAQETLEPCSQKIQRDLLRQLDQLELNYDCILVDAGSVLRDTTQRILDVADRVLIVTTPEPTAMADAYATIKSWKSRLGQGGVCHLLINQADSSVEAQAVMARLRKTANMFLQCGIEPAGWIPRDPHLAHSVMQRIPVILSQPEAPVSRAIFQLANRLMASASQRVQHSPFLSHMLQASTRVA